MNRKKSKELREKSSFLFNRFEPELSKTKFSFYFPGNISHFLWLYQTSEFIQCDEELAKKMEKKYRLYQNDGQIDLVLEPMRNIVSGFKKYQKRSWLAGGTLLGIGY